MLSLLRKLFHRAKAPAFQLPDESQTTATETGLRYVIHESGEGRAPTATDTVTVRYAGWTTDGKLFDASYPGKSRFPLGRVIPGWTEGLQLLQIGGRATFVLPPELAYGPRGAPPRIGPNATLVFHIELLAVG